MQLVVWCELLTLRQHVCQAMRRPSGGCAAIMRSKLFLKNAIVFILFLFD